MQKILQHIFHKNSLQEVEGPALEEIAREYPYFAPAHFLLAGKLQQGDAGIQAPQLQRALLYFNNPLWLKYQLESLLKDPAPAPDRLEEVADNTLSDTEEDTPGPSPDLMEDVVLHQEKDYADDEPVIHSSGFANVNRNLSQSASEISGLIHPGQQTEPKAIPEQERIEVSPILHQPAVVTSENDSEEAEQQTAGDLPLQAFHTVDYFASQGIRLSQDALANDKLGKQLKSFTEWLKTMRRLPEPVVEEVLEKIDDSDIAKYAAHSLEEKDVVTEAMAEVLVKQGKTAMAIEVYRKLSLLNQHKSAYFADKIEALKKH